MTRLYLCSKIWRTLVQYVTSSFAGAFALCARLCRAFWFNNIRQMAPVVDADVKSFVTEGLLAGRTYAWLCHAPNVA